MRPLLHMHTKERQSTFGGGGNSCMTISLGQANESRSVSTVPAESNFRGEAFTAYVVLVEFPCEMDNSAT